MNSPVLDVVDRRLIQALHADGRAPFNRIGEVIGVSDQTAARRYRRLRAAGVINVIGQTDPWQTGESRWGLRIQAAPDAAVAVAEALAARPDTAWVQLVSGGSEINCVVQTQDALQRDQLLLHKLPRTSRVIGFSAHAVLHQYFGGDGEFPPLVDELDADQLAALAPEPAYPDAAVALTSGDLPLIIALRRDGRATYAELAAATGWSETTCRRRLNELRGRGELYFDVDVNPAALGFGCEAVVWLSVPPAHLAEVGEAMAAHPEAAAVLATTGPTNLFAAVVCRDLPALYDYINVRLGALPAIQHLEVNPVIRGLKGAGSRP
jgi:DNA-binding Lrp family transcriptional regulator